jgi:hypothetical protein
VSASGRDGLGIIEFASERFGSISATGKAGIMGVILAVFKLAIDAGTAITEVFILPTGELARQAANVVQSFVGGIAGIIQQGAESTIAAIAPGQMWAAGPLAFTISIAAAAGGVYVMSVLLGVGFTSDTIPGTFTDFPFLGVDEEDEESDM